MLKVCWNFICKPLEVLFNIFLKEENFSSDWKKTNFCKRVVESDSAKLRKSLKQIHNWFKSLSGRSFSGKIFFHLILINQKFSVTKNVDFLSIYDLFEEKSESVFEREQSLTYNNFVLTKEKQYLYDYFKIILWDLRFS